MHKSFSIAIFLFVSYELTAQIDSRKQLSMPNNPLTKTQAFVRNFLDICIIEHFGYNALRKENEDIIKNILNNLDMNDYTIEARRMSYLAQKILGHVNAFALGTKFFAYLFISEDWFDTLPLQEKEALIRHELMHIKKNHSFKKLRFYAFSFIGLSLLAKIINNRIHTWAYQPLSTKEYINKVDSNDHFTQNVLDTKKVAIAQPMQRAIELCFATIGTKLLQLRYSRICEQEADIEAAKTMSNKQDYINLLTNLSEGQEENIRSKFKLKQTISDYLEPITKLLRTHPSSQERIAYIKEIS